MIGCGPCRCLSCEMANKMSFALAHHLEEQILMGYTTPAETEDPYSIPRSPLEEWPTPPGSQSIYHAMRRLGYSHGFSKDAQLEQDRCPYFSDPPVYRIESDAREKE